MKNRGTIMMIKRIVTVLISFSFLFSICNIQVLAKNYTVYSQNKDKRWKNYPYARMNINGYWEQATIGTSGCGLLSLVNAIAYMNGNFIEPTFLADYAIKKGDRKDGKGTDPAFYKHISDDYGAKYGFKKTSGSVSEMEKHIQKGGVVVAHADKPSGHYMAIVDYREKDNKFLILDSFVSNNRFGASSSWQMINKKTYITGNGKVRFTAFYYFENLKVSKPAAPTIAKGEELSDSSIKITWGAVNGATSYRVDMRRTDETDYKTLKKDVTSTTYTATNLKANSTYYFRVYANNSAGISSRSATYEVHTKPKAPGKPSVYSISDTELKIEWNTVANVNKYKIEYKKWSDSKWTTLKSNVTGTSYSHTGLKPGTKYEYQVSAIKEGNMGPEGNRSTHNYTSAPSDIKTKFTLLPRPSNSHNESNNAYVDLSWSKVNGDKTYVYDVYRDGTPIATKLTSTKYTDTGAVSGKIHQYRIKVYDKDNNYNHVISSVDCYAGGKITKNINLTPESESSMKITWDKPTSGTGLKYIVKKRNSSDTDWIDLTSTTNTYYVDNTVTAGNTYKYYIQVRDTAGNYLTSTNAKSALLNIEPNRIAIDKSAVSLTEDDSTNLTAIITPDNSFDKSVIWSSSNPDVAEITSNGTVTAKAAGTAVITAKTSNNKTAECTISVNAKAEAHTHTYGEWIVEEEATCETDGTAYRECSCGDKEIKTIPAPGHSYSEEWTVIKEANCHEEGEKAHICTVCDAQTDNTVIEKTEHSFGAWERKSASSCSEEGTETRTCGICGETEERATDVTNHEYVMTEETQPTLDTPGTRTYECSICHDTYTEEWVNVVQGGTVSIGGASPKAGETITIPVSINDNPGIAGFILHVNYDKDVLTPVKVEQDDLTASGTFAQSIEDDGTGNMSVTADYMAASNLKEDGILFNVTFKVSSTVDEGSYAVWLDGELIDEDMADVIPDVLGNVVTIADIIPGDVNQDRRVNANDTLLLAQYLIASPARQKTMFTANQRRAANLYNSKSDEITLRDAVRLAQLVAGYVFSNDNDIELQSFSLFSENSVNLEVESFEATAGESVYIPIDISNNTGIAGFDLKLDYDSNYITPVSVTAGDIISDGSFMTNVDSEGNNSELENITVQWNDADNMSEDGVLFFVEFAVNENVQTGQKLPVTLSCTNEDLTDMLFNSVNADVTQGEITVTEYSEDEVDAYEPEMLPYDITSVSMMLDDEMVIEDIPTNGNFDTKIDFVGTTEEFTPSIIAVAVYDVKGSLINIKSQTITEDILATETYTAHIGATDKEISEIKIFIWNSFSDLKPMADYVVIDNQSSI